MRREHAAVLALLVILLLAVGLIVRNGVQPEAGPEGVDDRDPPAAGRTLRLAEVSGSCGRTDPPVVISQTGGALGRCTIEVTSTDEPFWSIPVLERFLQPELRRLTVELLDCPAARIEIGETGEDLRPGDEVAVAVQAGGATVVLTSAPGCQLRTDIAG